MRFGEGKLENVPPGKAPGGGIEPGGNGGGPPGGAPMAPGGGIPPGGNGGRAVEGHVRISQNSEALRTEWGRATKTDRGWSKSGWSYEVLRTETKASRRRTTPTLVSGCDLVDDALGLVVTEC